MFGQFRDFFPTRRHPPAPSPAQADVTGGQGAEPVENAEHANGAHFAAGSAPRSATSRAGAGAGSSALGGTPASASASTGAAGAGAARTPAQQTGDKGEDAAAQFLAAKGHQVLERNWRAGRDEIDLITRDGAALVFVEVRTRAQNALVGGFHSINARKKAALRRVCGAYLKTCRPRPQTYRLDVVQIQMGKGGQMTIHHYAGIALFN